MMRICFLRNTILLLSFFFAIYLSAQDRITGLNSAARSEVIGQNGMVATSHHLATQIELDILKKGGNAVDAAIATNAALGLMDPTGSAIGGAYLLWSGKQIPNTCMDSTGVDDLLNY